MSSVRALYNMSQAWSAVFHVRNISITSNNTGRAADPRLTSEREYQELTGCIEDVRSKWVGYCGDSTTDACLAKGGIAELATLARRNKCGNCMEKAAVAIKFLTDAGVRPLDYMVLYRGLPIEHAFVLVGGERAGAANNPGTWG